ncbi:Uncharacterized protein FWK35_00018265 [Aphis craccivora]|uniref:Uncharacterized protein n=1 Tax=Aphis craccivora TaxID=307492 RepID=A0A6G0YQG9_APHCR|nr:Uncharacterized protein FWK35_00018265 [Aphis craccivora]
MYRTLSRDMRANDFGARASERVAAAAVNGDDGLSAATLLAGVSVRGRNIILCSADCARRPTYTPSGGVCTTYIYAYCIAMT